MTSTLRHQRMFENAATMFTEAKNRVRHHSTVFSLIEAHRNIINLMTIAETEGELRRVQALIVGLSDALDEGTERYRRMYEQSTIAAGGGK